MSSLNGVESRNEFIHGFFSQLRNSQMRCKFLLRAAVLSALVVLFVAYYRVNSLAEYSSSSSSSLSPGQHSVKKSVTTTSTAASTANDAQPTVELLPVATETALDEKKSVVVVVMTGHFLGERWAHPQECHPMSRERYLHLLHKFHLQSSFANSSLSSLWTGPIYCDLTSNRDLASTADAHWYHIPNLGQEQFDQEATAFQQRFNQSFVRVAFSMESSSYYPLVGDMDYLRKNFDIVMTYSPMSDVPLLYFPGGLNVPRSRMMFRRKRLSKILFMQRNCGSISKREDVVQWLINSLGEDVVHCWGTCLSNRDQAKPLNISSTSLEALPSLSAEDRKELQQLVDEIKTPEQLIEKLRDPFTPPELLLAHPLATVNFIRTQIPKRILFSLYRICITIENSIAPFYISEKIYDGFEAGCIPIYMSPPASVNMFPTNDSLISIKLKHDPDNTESNSEGFLADEGRKTEVLNEVRAVLKDERVFLRKLRWMLTDVEHHSTGVVDDKPDENTNNSNSEDGVMAVRESELNYGWRWSVNQSRMGESTECQMCRRVLTLQREKRYVRPSTGTARAAPSTTATDTSPAAAAELVDNNLVP